MRQFLVLFILLLNACAQNDVKPTVDVAKKEAANNVVLQDPSTKQQKRLHQLRVLRQQQQVAQRQLQQTLQQQGKMHNQQVMRHLKQAQAAAEQVRQQGKSMGVVIRPSVLEKIIAEQVRTQGQMPKAESAMQPKSAKSDFDKAFIWQQQAFLIKQEQKTDALDFSKAKAEHSSDAYWRYLNKCQSPCAYSEKAVDAYMQLQIAQDVAAYQSAEHENTPEALRYYLAHCDGVCAYRKSAQKRLKKSEAIARAVRQDSQYYAQARQYGTSPALAAYLSSCTECRDIAQLEAHWSQRQLAELPEEALQRIEHFNQPTAPSIKAVTKSVKISKVVVKKKERQKPKAIPQEKSKQALIAEALAKKEQWVGKMIMLKPDCLQMGSDNGSRDEQPVHKVCITQSYELGQYEVTQAQWKAVMGKNPAHFNGADRPIENVSWHDVQNFIAQLKQKTGLDYRLPTEAEWEYACRAGSDAEYCGGDVNSVAWYEGNANAKTHAVGLKRANSLGFYDMSGNVWEWVEDGYDERYYRHSPTNDPKGAIGATSRVYRGGSWYNGASYNRATNRDYDNPSNRDRNLGFRLARTL